MTRSAIRSSVSGSPTRFPCSSRYSKPRPRRRRVIPGCEQSTRLRRGTSRTLPGGYGAQPRHPLAGLRQTEGVRAIVLLDDEPRFRPYPFAPALDGPLRRAVEDAARVLSRTQGRFDGPIAFCHGVSRDGAVLVRAGRYAEAMVVFEEPTLG